MKNDRRLSYYYGPEDTAPVTKNSLPTKVCLISAFSLLMALMLFLMYTGSAVLYIHFWLYPAVAGLILFLLLGAGAYAIYNHCNSSKARRTAAIIGIGFMLMVGAIVFAFCSMFAKMLQPIGFFDSPEGENSIVIMRSQADEGELIQAYPAIGTQFYVAGLVCDGVLSNGVISGVEWEGERLAKISLEDINGNDAELTVDFSVLYDGEGEEE